MNAHTVPVRQSDPWKDADTLDASWPSDDCCDLCCATPVRTELDGDKLCQSCADKWCRGEGAAQREREADLVPIDSPAMKQAIARYQDAVRETELRRLAKGQAQFKRSGL